MEYFNSYTPVATTKRSAYVVNQEDYMTSVESTTSTSTSTETTDTSKKDKEKDIHFVHGGNSGDAPYSKVDYFSDSPTAVTTTVSAPIQGRYLRDRVLKLLESSLGWKHGVNFHLGEAVRDPNSGIGSRTSKHLTGEAVDITPVGMSFDQLKSALINNADVRNYFVANGLGIIDESTEAIRASHPWKSTGNHFHIGPDRLATRTWNSWLKQAGYAKKGGVLKAQEGVLIFANDYTYSYYPTTHLTIADAVNPYLELFNVEPEFVTKARAATPQTVTEKGNNARSRLEHLVFVNSGASNKPYKSDTVKQEQKVDTTTTASTQPSYNMDEFSTNFLDRIVKWESGGDPTKVGPKTRSGDRAYGLYQIMWNNVKNLSKYSKEEFLKDPQEQRRVAEILARQFWNQLTSQDKAAIKKKGLNRDQVQAAMWFSGLGGLRAYLRGEDRNDGAITVSKYISRLQ